RSTESSSGTRSVSEACIAPSSPARSTCSSLPWLKQLTSRRPSFRTERDVTRNDGHETPNRCRPMVEVRRTGCSGPDPARRLASRRNPSVQLIAAAQVGDLRQAREALAHGASGDAREPDGVTALMRACEGRHLALVRLLLEKGAAVNAASAQRMTALLFSV